MCFYQSIISGLETFTLEKILYGKEKGTGVEYAQIFRQSGDILTYAPHTLEAKEQLIKSLEKEIDHLVKQFRDRGIICFVAHSFITPADFPNVVKNVEIDPDSYYEEDITHYPEWYKESKDLTKNIDHLIRWTRVCLPEILKGERE